MMKLKEEFLCSALDKFKQMIVHGECSKADINYFCNFSKHELDRRGASIDKNAWLTKEEASEVLGVSTSTFDRMVLKGILSRGKKVVGQNKLVWKCEQIEQLNKMRLLKVNG